MVAKAITRTLLGELGNDALCLLAGVWSDDDCPPSVQVAALKHCQAFIASRADGTDFKQDFQIIIPSLLLALQSPDRSTRETAMDCISALATSDSSTKDVPVYAFDSLYGASSGMATRICLRTGN